MSGHVLQLRGGTTEEHSSFTGAPREVTVDTTKNSLVVHDGSTLGGNPIEEVVYGCIKSRIDNQIDEEVKEVVNTRLDDIYIDVQGSSIHESTVEGYVHKLEILGNTVQDASNLADIRSVGNKVEGQELYEIPVVSTNNIIDVKSTTIGDEAIHYNIEPIRQSFEVMRLKGYTVSILIHKNNSWQRNVVIKTNTLTAINLNDGEYVNQILLYAQDGWDLSKQYNLTNIIHANIKLEHQQLTILSPTPLEKVGDVRDRVIEKDGVWGVEKNVETVVFNGSESWKKSGYTIEGYSSFYIDKPNNFDNNNNYICDKFNVMSFAHWSNLASEFTCVGISDINIRILSTKLSTQDVAGFKQWLQNNNVLVKYQTTSPTFIPLPHSQQVKLRTFANKTNISFLTEIEGTIKAQVPKSLGATVNTHTEQINNLNKELDRVKKLEESTVSTVETESDFTTVEATSNGYFEDVKLEGRTLVNCLKLDEDWFTEETTLETNSTTNVGLSNYNKGFDLSLLKDNTTYTVIPFVDYTVVTKGELYIQLNTEINGNSNSLFRIFENMFNKPSLITTKELTNKSSRSLFIGGKDCSYKVRSVKILILEGDHTQNPPSYFEGLKSVGQSATTSEDGADEIVVESVKGDGNLVEFLEVGGTMGTSTNFGSDYNHKMYFRSNYINVQGLNTISYSFSHKDKAVKNPLYCFYDKNKKGIPPYKYGVTVDVPSSAKYVRFEGGLNDVSDTTPYINDINLMISAGDVPKPYTPHISDKKRLLYYNNETQMWEKPILRQWDSIEKHANGKYYYHQRSAEVVLNGSEGWGIGNSSNDTTLLMYFRPSEVPKSYTWGICDKFNFQTTNNESIRNTEYVYVDTDINIRINKSRLSTQDVQGFKQWLQANNVTVVYQLAQEKVYECTNIDLITYANETNYIVESGAIEPKSILKVHNNISNVVKILQQKVSLLENKFIEGLKKVLAGDMYSLAEILYPEDFVNTTQVINDNSDKSTVVCCYSKE